jgi:hypothetical protein
MKQKHDIIRFRLRTQRKFINIIQNNNRECIFIHEK